MKKYILLIITTMAPMWSCKDFLEEKLVSTLTQDYYNTEVGLEGLIKGLYTYARIKHEWDAAGARLIEPETDAYMTQNPATYATASTDALTSASSGIGGNMNNFLGADNTQDYAPQGAYPHINNCNIALDRIDNTKPGKFGTDEAFNKKRKAEVLFLRSWAYYLITNQLGAVPLVLTPKYEDNGIYYYPKASLEDIYKQIITDLRFAYDNLPGADQTDRGRANKWATGHFLAKLYLHRAQAASFEGLSDASNRHLGMLFKGNVATDLDSAIYFTTDVINIVGGTAALATDYWTLFNPSVSETSPAKEVLWAAQFDVLGSTKGRFGNRSCNYHIGSYEVETNVHRSGNIAYGRPFASFKPSDWGYDNFRDKANDSRYDKTFGAEFLATTGASNPVLWTANTAAYWNANKPASEPTVAVDEIKAKIGKRALIFIENDRSEALDSATVHGQPFLFAARWVHSAKTNKYYYRFYPGKTLRNIGLNTTTRNIYMGSKKFTDPNRGGGDYTSEAGVRDAILMRLAETYLIRAEAYGRKGMYTQAVSDINVLRQRAAYKVGESRPSYLVQWDPDAAVLPAAEKITPYTVTVNSYSAIQVSENHFTPGMPEANNEGYIPGLSMADMFIHFIYNEKAREFLSEGIAWEDQHNAGILYDRITQFNQMASDKTGIWPTADNPEGTGGQNGNGKGQYKTFHTFRPWPDAFLTLLTDESGRPLDQESRNAYQNPGYAGN